MATDAENLAILVEARDNIVRTIREYSKAPKPSYEIDGQKVSWATYLAQLLKDLKALEEAIVAMDETYEFTSTLYT